MKTISIPAETAETMAHYVAAADPILAKSAELDKSIPSAVDLLVSRGIVLSDAREVKVAEFRKNPSKLLGEMSKLAAATSVGRGENFVKLSDKRNAADAAYEDALLS
jgi:hypothetical protein